MGERASKTILLALPLLTVTVVCFALFVVGAPRTYAGARVYGGPTDDVTRASLRLAVVERFAELDTPLHAVSVAVESELADGRRVVRSASTDEAGSAHVDLDFGDRESRGPLSLTLTRPGKFGLLGQGKVELGAAEWLAGMHLRGGWIPAKKSGALGIRVAPGRGAFAVPFSDPLIIDVRDGTAPVANAELRLEADGVTLENAESRATTTDASGRAFVRLAPRDSVASLKVTATTSDGKSGEWYAMLPIVTGALHARVQDGKLVLESAVTGERVFWALEAEREKFAGGVIELDPDGKGGARAMIALPALPQGPVYAVVSREPELDSASTVGWPIAPPEPDLHAPEPPLARSVPDRLLLDGLTRGQAEEAERRRTARSIAIVFSALAAVLAGLLLVHASKKSAERLHRHLTDAGAEPPEIRALSPRAARATTLAIALLCVLMGFAVVALVAMYRMS